MFIAFLIDDHFLFCFEWVGDKIKLEVQLCSEQREQFPEKLSSSRKETLISQFSENLSEVFLAKLREFRIIAKVE